INAAGLKPTPRCGEPQKTNPSAWLGFVTLTQVTMASAYWWRILLRLRDRLLRQHLLRLRLVHAGLLWGLHLHRRIHRRLVGADVLEQHRAFRGVLLGQAGAWTSDRRTSDRIGNRGAIPIVD